MRISVRVLLLVAGLAAVSGCVVPQVTTRSLLAEMTDLSNVSRYPDPPFTCRQFSSYDRKSTTADDHETWFANADCGQYLRSEEHDGRVEYVMMDTDGPGAIVRIWSANPKGTLRIYLDHNEQPVIESPMEELLGGKYPGIPEPIAGTRSRGWNSYFPIAYAEHCKITSDADGFYYQVNYRTYPAGTVVESFRVGDLSQRRWQIARTSDRLSSPRTAAKIAGWGQREKTFSLFEAFSEQGVEHTDRPLIEPGESRDICTWTGSRAITEMVIQIMAEDQVAALRKLILHIEFDGEETVACPLGDFFGAAPGINPYASLPVGVTPDGWLWSHWYMPFRENARVYLENLGTDTVAVGASVTTVPHRWTDDSMYFHAKWRGDFEVPTRPMQDWNYLTVDGKGVFAGVAFAIANPVRAWWGEGDEKIYVDGETFPSTFGTGTEDYYGYAWCCPEPFTHAYHNQPRCDGPGNFGRTAVNRFHILDRIPFEKNFRFDMELWHWADDVKVDMSVVAYWYATPGSTDGFKPISPDDLRVTVMPPYVAPRVAGALEGEEMRIVEMTGGNQEVQDWEGLSNEQHIWWRSANPGDRFTLGFNVEEAGRYRIFARFLSANDYAIAQPYINGQKAGEPIDFFNPNVKPADECDLGEFDLTAGENQVTLEIVSANEQAIKSYMTGLDYVRLEQAD